ncbi:aldehyde dehydrogenase, dimeric NADP-preferring-like isoform X2 [Lytechinus variegatus]|uniref:aldehyde dehydrogenase, dimeric NADP-preferring-like isoform X2 n=1 Tax=Lytechinus variegatus TaxID=7654 RepID=UPI001BB28835|nr:aldehyde dehydrogenase, dimeric NADP-preferring-like isoform X2 [Lytechinus variegatus]
MADIGVDAKMMVEKCRRAFDEGKTRSYEARIQHLQNLLRMIAENKKAFVDAMYKDLRKPEFESVTFEVDFGYNECVLAINELQHWMKPEKVAIPMAGVGKQCFINRDPLGLVLIIGAWNYPFQLPIHPLIGAIAAGNTAIIKPSEVSPATAQLFEELFPKYMDTSCFQLVTGDAVVTTALLEQRFDHIFFTGSTSIGKIVQMAAAKHLTPVTLELGGKCPFYIDSNCDIDVAVHRVASSKFYNAGQTCIAPDFIICRKDQTDRVVSCLRKAVKEFFGENPKNSRDYGRVVNARHFKRICALLDGQEIEIGGESDEDDLYIAPTVIINAKDTDGIMQEEIFGPLLPIFNLESPEEAIRFINSREKPLALYVFSSNMRVIDQFRNQTSSGMFCGNECMVQGGVETLPFGGIGHSGTGNYHGKFTFETFSHRKACMVDPMYTVSELARRVFYAPYTDRKTAIISWILRKKPKNRTMSFFFQVTGLVVLLAVLYKVFVP